MSLEIDIRRVRLVRLKGEDLWRRVRPGTFDFDDYEFVKMQGRGWAPRVLGYDPQQPTGFTFVEDDDDIDAVEDRRLFGPVSSIAAVQYVGDVDPGRREG